MTSWLPHRESSPALLLLSDLQSPLFLFVYSLPGFSSVLFQHQQQQQRVKGLKVLCAVRYEGPLNCGLFGDSWNVFHCNRRPTLNSRPSSPQAACLPMSIIIVGVGPAEFDGKCFIFHISEMFVTPGVRGAERMTETWRNNSLYYRPAGWSDQVYRFYW